VDEIHRHHARPQGHKFSIGLLDADGTRVGVAIVGRPVARHLDDGRTLEVTRLATDGSANACSALYGATWRTTRNLGYRRLITYTQAGESGASLRAAGFLNIATRAARRGWDVPSRPRHRAEVETVPQLWEISTDDAPALTSWRDETRDETPPRDVTTTVTTCSVCREPTTPARTGRPRRYCSQACRQAAYRNRRRSD